MRSAAQKAGIQARGRDVAHGARQAAQPEPERAPAPTLAERGLKSIEGKQARLCVGGHMQREGDGRAPAQTDGHGRGPTQIGKALGTAGGGTTRRGETHNASAATEING